MIVSSAKDIGLLIKNKRKEIGLTQKEASRIINVGIRFFSELENGKPTLEIDKVLRVLKFFGIELEARDK